MAVMKRSKKSADANIPTSSMADIAFLLLIFFMVTTVFKVDSGISLNLPYAEKVEKLQRKNLSIVWVNDKGQIAIEDKFVPVKFVSVLMQQKMFETNGQLIVEIKADRTARYGTIDAIFNQLKAANALKVVLGARHPGSGR